MIKSLFILFTFPFVLFAQNKSVDSLKLLINNASHDTTRCNLMIQLSDLVAEREWEKQMQEINLFCNNKLKSGTNTAQENLYYKRHSANTSNFIGLINSNKGNVLLAIDYFNQSLKIREEIGDKLGVASSINNLGLIYKNLGNISKALEYYSKSLKMHEELGDKPGVATIINNIGLLYKNQDDFSKAFEYYSRSLKINEELENKEGIAIALNNIAFIYLKLGDPTVTISKEAAFKAGILKALDCNLRSLKMEEERNNKRGIANSLNNIGALYDKYGKYLNTDSKLDLQKTSIIKALEYYNKSLILRKEVGDKSGEASTLNNIGIVYQRQGQFSKAIEYGNKSMSLSKQLGFPKQIKESADLLYSAFKKSGKHQLALENYELYVKMRDSISNESTRKVSIKSQLKYEYEKQAAADSVAHAKESEIKNMELAKQKVEIKAKKNQQYALFGGLALVIIFAGFMYHRFKITQKQKYIIEEQKLIVEQQKNLVEEKQKEVLDSIHYAKRIQMALLPSEKKVENILIRLQKER